jgi:hypothetical protein
MITLAFLADAWLEGAVAELRAGVRRFVLDELGVDLGSTARTVRAPVAVAEAAPEPDPRAAKVAAARAVIARWMAARAAQAGDGPGAPAGLQLRAAAAERAARCRAFLAQRPEEGPSR